MSLPINLEDIIGMTETEAGDWIKSHDSNLTLYVICKNGKKITAPYFKGSVYVTIKDDFITSYSIT